MDVTKDFLRSGQGARPGKRLTACRGLVIHWIGVSQGHAAVIRRNYERDILGTQYISDWHDGRIIQTMPEDEVAYHVGSERGYTATKRAICGSDNPNWYLVGIECCIDPATVIPGDYAAAGKYMDLGKPSEVQYEALVGFAADFLTRHKLTLDNLYRHYDITGKYCHAWFLKDPARWVAFKADVKARMEGQELTQKQFNIMLERALAAREAALSAQPVASWAEEDREWAMAQGITDGTRPCSGVARQEVWAMLHRMETK